MRRSAVVLSSVLVLALPSIPRAFVSFDDTSYLHPDGGSNSREDDAPHLVTDGAGNWVAVTSGPSVSTSHDNGVTWSAPVAIPPGGSYPGFWFLEAMAETDGLGTWLLVWAGDPDALNSGADSEVYLSRSIDNGDTWSTGVAFASNAATDTVSDSRPRLATDGSGNWMAVWYSRDPVNDDDDLRFSVSVDNGVTWSPIDWIDPLSPFDNQDDSFPSVATDGAGNWVVVYNNNPGMTTGKLRVFRSNDFGASWSGPLQTSTTLGLAVPDIRSGGPGVFLTAHTNLLFNIGRSTNGGAGWIMTPISGALGAAQSRARIAGDGQGGWVAVWSSHDDPAGIKGTDADVAFARSADNGENWTAPAFLNSDAPTDIEDDDWAVIETDQAGTWIAAWQRDLGSEDDIAMSISAALCPLARRNDCVASIEAGKSKIGFGDKIDDAKDKMKFKVSKGDMTDPSDFGDPTATGDLVFCVWDSDANVDRLVLQIPLEGGVQCAGAPCWEATSNGFAYVDKDLENGPFAKVKLAAGAPGKTSVALLGKGGALLPPRVPFANDTSVAAQLVSQDTNICWGATFSAPKKNEIFKYIAASD